MNVEQEQLLQSLARSIVGGGDDLKFDRGTATRAGLDIVARNKYLTTFLVCHIVTIPSEKKLERTGMHVREALKYLAEMMALRSEGLITYAEGAPNADLTFLTADNDPEVTQEIGHTTSNQEG